MRFKFLTLITGIVLLMTTSCRHLQDIFDEVEPGKPQLKEFATGFASPIGLAKDEEGRLWVTEVGTGKNDGKVSVIMPNGTKHIAVEGFPSVFNAQEGVLEGLNHLLVKDNMLWALHVDGFLYKVDLHTFEPGNSPLQASNLEKENIGKFVLDYDFEQDAQDTNPYNLTTGPEGDIFIADAGANAIIRRNKSGELSVFATFPNIVNPTPVGPPTIQSVPTGIAFNGEKFFVSSLIGFPFPEGKARIYQVDLQGKTTVYQDGFTSLTDIILSANHRPVVVQIGVWGAQGFTANTGRVLQIVGTKTKVLAEKLNMPTSIVRNTYDSYYLNSLADGKVYKLINAK